MRGVVWLAMAMIARGFAQELPTHDGEEGALEVDPPLLIQARSADGSLILTGPAGTPAPPADLLQLEKDLARAKRIAAGAEGLYRAGIISKVEAEERELRVVRLEAKFAEARLLVVKEQLTAETETTVAAAEATAAAAVAQRHRAELEAALRNLQRQQKLLALGSGRKSDVNRAEQRLAELQRAGD